MKPFNAMIKRNAKPGGGLFVGLRWHFAVLVASDKAFKLIGGRFYKQPTWRVWHLDVGLITHTVSFYFRSQMPFSSARRATVSTPSSRGRSSRRAPISKNIGLLLLLCFICGCGTAPLNYGKSSRSRARITFYHPHEDKWGSRIATGGRAVEGKTVAAARVLPLGTPVEIPKLAGVVGTGNFVVEDRGRDVERAKAGHGLPVIDVYVSSRRRYNWCRKFLPPVMELVLP
jgi:3D (Asp-Asp-Asp) domain-containing protein